MIRRTLSILCLAATLAAPAAAETLEAAHFGASSAILELQQFRAPQMPKVRRADFKVSTLQQEEETPLVSPVTFTSPTGGAVSKVIKEVALAPALNRHLKTTLQYSIGGSNVWVSGAFNRAQDAFVSILVDGQPAKFFNVKDLVTSPQTMTVGSAQVRVSVSPDLTDMLQSEIVLWDKTANKKNRITLQEMLDAVAAAGEAVAATGQTYQLFYYDDVSGGTKSFCFILKDPKGELHIFLVPLELVPTSGNPAVFKMYQSKPIGLIISGGKLQVLE